MLGEVLVSRRRRALENNHGAYGLTRSATKRLDDESELIPDESKINEFKPVESTMSDSWSDSWSVARNQSPMSHCVNE